MEGQDETRPEGFPEEATTTATKKKKRHHRLVDLLPPEPPAPHRIISLLARFVPFLASQELLMRIAGTILAIAVVRIGGCVPLPEAKQAFYAATRVAAEAAAAAAAAAVSASSSSSSAAAAAASAAATAASAAATAAASNGIHSAAAVAEIFGRGLESRASLGALALGIGPSIQAGWLFALARLKIPGPLQYLRNAIEEQRRGGREGLAELSLWTNAVGIFFALVMGLQASAALLSKASTLARSAAAEGAAFAVSAAVKGRAKAAVAAASAAEAAAQAAAEALRSSVPAFSTSAFLAMTLTLVAGACLVHFVADQVEERGLGGSGTSLLICIGFLGEYGASLAAFWPAVLLRSADATPALASFIYSRVSSLPAAVASAFSFSSPPAVSAAGCLSSLLISLAPFLALAKTLAPSVLGSAALLYAGLFVTRLELRLPLVVYRRRRVPRGELGDEGGGNLVGPAANAAEAERQLLQRREQQQQLQSSSKWKREREGASLLGLSVLSPTASSLPVRLAPSGMAPLLTAALFVSVGPMGLSLVSRGAAEALAAWLARPLVGPLAMASLTLLGEAAMAAGGEAPKEAAEWMASAETGLVGVPPGEATAAALRETMGAARLAGGALLAIMYLAGCALDAWCALPMPVVAAPGVAARGGALTHSPSSVALLLTASFIMGAERQVRSLVQLPRLAAELAAERAELREILMDLEEEEEAVEGAVEEEVEAEEEELESEEEDER